MTIKSPYYFIKRPCSRKEAPEAFHHQLKTDRYDISFDITWKTLTPTAANPCNAPGMEDKCPYGMAGYNRRWLIVGDKLVISPFTVKSAIANGFANLLGGCYRVTTGEVGHQDSLDGGKYPYGGAYKRYRVAMDRSKPGVVKSVVSNDNESKTFSIQPVEEFYLNDSLSISLNPGDNVFITIKERRRNKPPIIGSSISHTKSTLTGDVIEAIYAGPYRCGRDAAPPHLQHKHRFYREKTDPALFCTIRKENFYKKGDLVKIVHLGPNQWYANLDGLSEVPGQNFIYYEAFNGVIKHIGKNFQFKALFYHPDTVPPVKQASCTQMNELCPRCAMFGMTDESAIEKKEAVGFMGRFKSAALVNNLVLEEKPFDRPYPFLQNHQKVSLKKWMTADIKTPIARQELLPIQGQPKDNKRGVKGYFDPATGDMQGSKAYRHGKLETADNIQKVDQRTDDYSHKLRNYAMVCKKDLEFHGTVGAVNCTVDEIAALITLLHEPVAHHGFKIGLGKSFAMGSVESQINAIWIRTQNNYSWTKIPYLSHLPSDISIAVETLKSVHDKVNNLEGRDTYELRFPNDLKNYWQEFDKNSKA